MKTIDVMEGDEFVADKYLCQMRGGMFRNFWAGGVSGWAKGGRLAENPKLRPVSTDDALLILETAGYTITPGEAEKPAISVSPGAREVAAKMQNTPQPKSGFQLAWDAAQCEGDKPAPLTFMDDLVERTEKAQCQKKTTSPVLTAEAERTEKVPTDSGKVGTDKPAAKPAPQHNKSDEKSCFRDAVPLVDAVWVGIRSHDGHEYLYAYTSRAAADATWGPSITSGTARIVRVASVDEEARKDIHGLRDAVTVAYNNVCGRLSALESRIAAEKTDRPLWVNRYDAPTAEEIQAAVDLAKRLRAERDKPADKPAARVVKAPGMAEGGKNKEGAALYDLGARHQDVRWRKALASQGITIADEGSSSNG